ncbi:GPI inositol-deacylase [Chitinophagales bacterium]|nr:GPI inositol-deacylase [Chitinophagales bacterium]
MQSKREDDSDVQAIVQLLAAATIGTTNLVEDVHRRIVHPPLLPSTPIQNLISKIAGWSFSATRGITKVVAGTIDTGLSVLPSFGNIKETEKKEALRSVLNGVIGDYLERENNGLQIKMEFRHKGNSFSVNEKLASNLIPNPKRRIILCVHGLCMNDIQWTSNNHNHGDELAKEMDATAIHLHYNTGRHISSNGKEFSELLQNLLGAWPVPVEEIVILAHSMGGLVSRSALHYGLEENKEWTEYIKKVVFLGTPHHGAGLEKLGSYVDRALESFPYLKPFARLGKIRSAGITDLRYGNLLQRDWEKQLQYNAPSDLREHLPLVEGINYFAVAAHIDPAAKSVSAKVVGDGLVTEESAFGRHKYPEKCLNFEADKTLLVGATDHWGLLSSPIVYEQLKKWLVVS